MLFRYMISQSDSYPLLGFKTVRDWCKSMNIFDGRFTMAFVADLFTTAN